MVTGIVTTGLARFSLEVLRERAMLALSDPAGELDAVAPLDVEQATYNYMAASAELARRRPAVMAETTYMGSLVDALAIPAGRHKGTMRCPAHDDRNASLSWQWSDTGMLLVHCHAGCTFDDIRRAVL